MGITNQPPDLLPGTLDMLVLRTLIRGPMHGYGIADRLRQVSQDVLQVGESSLYPALQRLLLNGWVKAEWGASENVRVLRGEVAARGESERWPVAASHTVEIEHDDLRDARGDRGTR